MLTLENLGKQLKLLREKQNLSYSKLQKLSGIRKEYLRKIEIGQAKKVRIDHIECLCNCFDISIIEFLRKIE